MNVSKILLITALLSAPALATPGGILNALNNMADDAIKQEQQRQDARHNSRNRNKHKNTPMPSFGWQHAKGWGSTGGSKAYCFSSSNRYYSKYKR